MRKFLILGVGGIAAFGACSAVAVYVLTQPGTGSPRPAGPLDAEVAEALEASQVYQPAPPAVVPPAPPPGEDPLQARVRSWTREEASVRFVSEYEGNAYDPAAQAKKQAEIKSTLKRGRLGKPPRSAEDLE